MLDIDLHPLHTDQWEIISFALKLWAISPNHTNTKSQELGHSQAIKRKVFKIEIALIHLCVYIYLKEQNKLLIVAAEVETLINSSQIITLSFCVSRFCKWQIYNFIVYIVTILWTAAFLYGAKVLCSPLLSFSLQKKIKRDEERKIILPVHTEINTMYTYIYDTSHFKIQSLNFRLNTWVWSYSTEC